MVNSSAKVGMLVLLIFAVVCVAFGAVFIQQGMSKNKMITEAMAFEKVKYGGEDAKGAIVGVIDTPAEAMMMSEILKEHRINDYGYYSELKRDDPKRDQILKAITMETSLNLAQMGYGLVTIVEVTGAFMIIVGLALGTVAFVIRPRNN